MQDAAFLKCVFASVVPHVFLMSDFLVVSDMVENIVLVWVVLVLVVLVWVAASASFGRPWVAASSSFRSNAPFFDAVFVLMFFVFLGLACLCALCCQYWNLMSPPVCRYGKSAQKLV